HGGPGERERKSAAVGRRAVFARPLAPRAERRPRGGDDRPEDERSLRPDELERDFAQHAAVRRGKPRRLHVRQVAHERRDERRERGERDELARDVETARAAVAASEKRE